MGKVLGRLKPDEGVDVLRSLLERHPELVPEAEGIALAMMTVSDRDAAMVDVERAVLALDMDDLGTRAGRTSRGYVEPPEDAWELLSESALRCIDAHAHLGNLAFDDSPEQAIVHYEVGIGVGEPSLPAGFDGLLAWGRIDNRPFLRCLHGHGLCLWRLGRLSEAQGVFERIPSLNPNDHQGVRFCCEDVRNGRSWSEAQARDDEAAAAGRRRFD